MGGVTQLMDNCCLNHNGLVKSLFPLASTRMAFLCSLQTYVRLGYLRRRWLTTKSLRALGSYSFMSTYLPILSLRDHIDLQSCP